MNDNRKHKRILAVCKLMNEQNQLIGFALDLTVEGIRMIVPKTFFNKPEFSLFVEVNYKEDEDKKSKITLIIQQKWRQSKDENFDEIGGLLIDVSPKNEFNELLAYCHKNSQIYDFDF